MMSDASMANVDGNNRSGKVSSCVRLMSFSAGGHRSAYDAVLIRLLEARGIELSPSADAHADFFPMLDDRISVFFWVACSNAFRGRRTVGLFFRPAEALKRNALRYWIKYLLFRALKLVPGTRILTIMPFYLNPRFSEVAHDWIYDLQFWDLGLLQPERGEARQRMADEVYNQSNGRRIIVALGGQGRNKGFDVLVQLLTESHHIAKQYFFVVAGRVEPECKTLADKFVTAGGLLLDRVITDQELYGLYDVADLVWCCYSKDYNQASGIFGRSIQFGRTCVVRRSSYMHSFGKKLSVPMLDLDPDEPIERLAERLATWHKPSHSGEHSRGGEATNRAIREMQEKSCETLLTALGLRG